MLSGMFINCNDWDTKQRQQTCKSILAFAKQQEIQNLGHKTVFSIGYEGVEWTVWLSIKTCDWLLCAW